MAISNMNHTFISRVPTKMNEPFEAACLSELAVTQDDFTPLNSQGAARQDHKPVIISGKIRQCFLAGPLTLHHVH